MADEGRPLLILSAAIAGIIENWVRVHDKRKLWIKFRKVDLLRLTKLQVWSWRYKLPIDEILTLTVPALRRKFKSRKSYGLGVSVATLCGKANERILQEAIDEKYPGGEQIAVWRQEERAAQLEAEECEELDGMRMKASTEKNILESDSIREYLSEYKRRVVAARNKQRNEASNPIRKRKRYRWNPWL